ncbi:putative MFS transporter [Amylocarpus encephaloides]|uniref:MFS transporter n=1 Tax=Amylocarpus encephaloides TaxID=45428 RepID=A0A9P8C4Y5_9HELO|nr:putative MFS transporter [Amylocarpus encephaloides]
MSPQEATETPPKAWHLRRPRALFSRHSASNGNEAGNGEGQDETTDITKGRPSARWSMGVLNVPSTYEVPGSVMLLSDHRNHPLGLRQTPAVTSSSTLPPQPHTPIIDRRTSRSRSRSRQGRTQITKTTPDGAVILDPQPEESKNDPLNWPKWRRDAALLSLGLYCMLGGGMTPILAAGFEDVSQTYGVPVSRVALTTGLYMMGLGVGSVFTSPTAILFGKRPVYLVCAIMFIGTSCWCAASPSFNSLLIARIFQGVSVSSVECLPSATIAEIFFLHERAYRIGIYTLLLLGGKNLIPLVSAAIIESMDWRWVFWIVAMVVGVSGALLFLFVPESFWDRTPHPKSRKPSRKHPLFSDKKVSHPQTMASFEKTYDEEKTIEHPPTRPPVTQHASFRSVAFSQIETPSRNLEDQVDGTGPAPRKAPGALKLETEIVRHDSQDETLSKPGPLPALHHPSPSRQSLGPQTPDPAPEARVGSRDGPPPSLDGAASISGLAPRPFQYTSDLRDRPALSFIQQMRPFSGRLSNDNWFHVAARPFILFAYPAVLWSSIVYACAVGWLIVLSESVSEIYRNHDTYNFSALSTGLVYISPFIGGILGTVVAGKVSDVIVRNMTRRNGGLFEPEFRLIMGIPITITTAIGLMGYGWSAQERDAWIVPTIFFGVTSFGCSLASTTSITFCVDSYRQYAGEALVTLNFSKNIFHGLVFSLFFNRWLEADGSRMVFIWLGVIQLVLMTLTIPMYIFGKRARMWTVKMNLMEKF